MQALSSSNKIATHRESINSSCSLVQLIPTIGQTQRINTGSRAALSIDAAYVFRFGSFQNVGRGLAITEDNRPSVPVALERSSLSPASSAAEPARVLVSSSEANSFERRGATILRFSISWRTRATSASFCRKSSRASFKTNSSESREETNFSSGFRDRHWQRLFPSAAELHKRPSSVLLGRADPSQRSRS